MELVAEKYKKSEVGLIPSDWDVFKLGDCLLRNPDYGINAAAVEYDDTLPTYLRITDISEDGKFIRSNKASVNNSLANAYYLEKGDIVFARTGASVGKTYLYNENDGRLVFAGFLIRITPNPEIVDCFYLIYLTQTKAYWAWVSANSMRSGQPGLNSNEYKSFQISLPPTKAEQTLIATVLSDTDALISGLEKLIAKKRNIKQGAMQKLLQPKAGWDKKRVKEIVQTPVTDGPNETPIFYDMGIPFLSVNNLVDKKIDFTDLRFITMEDHLIYSKKCKPQRNDILLGKAASVGKVAIVETDLEFNIWSPIAMIRVKSDYSSKYVYYYLQTKDIVKQIEFFTNSSSQGNIGMGDIEKLEIPFPKTLNEQNEIATILSDMDNEISLLEKKVSKTKSLKQGMMQELLTGKIRLI